MMLDTDNLRLVPFTPQQLLALIERPEQFLELAGVSADAGMHVLFTSGEISPAWLATLRTLEHADPWILGFAVVDREKQLVVGSAGFKGGPDAEGAVEIAYGIVPAFEGRGYATEAARALTAYALGSGQVSLVIAHTLATPNASTHVLTKCGFQRTGEFVDPDDGPVWRWERVEGARA